MITMNAFRAYRYYLALKMHFTTDRYDVIKHKGRIKASRESFMKHEYMYQKLAKQYPDNEIVNFLVSNFVSGNQWGGVFDSQSNETYLKWKKRIESLTYTFKSDLQTILMDLNLNVFDENQIFLVQKNQHPYIIRAYMSKKISLETLVILNKLFKFCDNFDNQIEENFVWPDISRLIKKYSPFVKIDKEKYLGIVRGL